MIGDTEYYVNGVKQRKSELADSSWLRKFWGLLDPFISEDVDEIRCLALGLICDHFNPRFQLALLLLIAERYKISKITAWDPAFSNQDIEVLQVFGIPVLEPNPEPSLRIFWYIPHGPLKLISSLPLILGPSVYLGNDLTQFDLDTEDSASLAEYKKSAVIKPIPVTKNDRWYTAFNAMAIHRRDASA